MCRLFVVFADCTLPEAFVMASVPDAIPRRLGLLFERRLAAAPQQYRGGSRS